MNLIKIYSQCESCFYIFLFNYKYCHIIKNNWFLIIVLKFIYKIVLIVDSIKKLY